MDNGDVDDIDQNSSSQQEKGTPTFQHHVIDVACPTSIAITSNTIILTCVT